MLGIPGQLVPDDVVLCGGVWMMRLNREDILTMLATGLLIVVVMEMMVWAITGDYVR